MFDEERAGDRIFNEHGSDVDNNGHLEINNSAFAYMDAHVVHEPQES
jgi:hypothetical protein